MKRISRVFLSVIAAASLSSTAMAAIEFGLPVNINFGAADAALTAINNVNGLEFGSFGVTGPTGRIAANGTDTNGDFVLSPGDTTRVVGHALIGSVNTTTGEIDPVDSGQAKSFQFTGVLRNLDGTITATPFGIVNQFTQSAGFLDLYLDIASAGAAFDVSNVATSADGIKVATFQILSGFTSITPGIITASQIEFLLIDQLGSATASLADDFFQLINGNDPLANGSLLATQVLSVDTRTNPPATLTGINYGGAGGPVDIAGGPGGFAGTPGVFKPSGTLGFDVVSNVDGNASFGVTPEPASLLVWSGIAAAGVVFARRRMIVKG